MNYAILRYEKRSLGQAAAMARHALREAPETPNADAALKGQNRRLAGSGTAAGVMATLRAKLPEKRRKDAVPCIEVFVGGSHETLASMPRERQDEYFKDSLGWIARHFGGGANIVSAVIHRDEQTPHMQVLLVPLLDGKLNAKKLVGNRQDMVNAQTEFAEMVGSRYGLRRGEKGSPAKHTSIKQFYGAIEAAGRADALPPRTPVPPALPEPGMFSNAETRAEYDKREKERKSAMEANKRRQTEIEKLARVGIATHGRGRRKLPRQFSDLDRLEADTKRGRELLSKQRQEYNDRAEALKQIVADVPRLEAQRDALQAQLDALQESLRPPAPPEALDEPPAPSGPRPKG